MFDIEGSFAILCIAIYGSLLPTLGIIERTQSSLLAAEMEMRYTLYY